MLGAALKESLGAEEFAFLMGGFAPLPSRIAVAVSGGPDSMALAYCVKRWAARDCVALLVEHGLRDESAAEAATVCARLRQMGLDAHILPWAHEALSSRVEESARKARYRLLFEACRRFGAGALLTAHHRGDQAETILMRLAKGSGLDGLAGILPEAMRDEIRILRPFLTVPKARLIATCEEAGLQTVTDPTNASEKYARGRLRKIMPLLASEGLTEESLSSLGQRLRESKDALESVTRDFLKKAAKAECGGSVTLDREALCALPRALALRALTAGLRYVHEDDHPPEYAALSGLYETISSAGADTARTLYGCLVSISGKKIAILREPSAATDVKLLASGETVLWDKRWFVTGDTRTAPLTIRALGSPSHETVDAFAPQLRRQIPQGRIRATLPALWDGESLRAIPSFDKDLPLRMVYRKLSFP